MQEQRDTAAGRSRQFGRVGAVAIVVTGALLAAVFSTASRVPSDQVDQDEIPGIKIGNAARGDPSPDAGGDGRSARDGRAEAGVRGERDDVAEPESRRDTTRGEPPPGDPGGAGPEPRRVDDGPAQPRPGAEPHDDAPSVPAPGARPGGQDTDDRAAPEADAGPDDVQPGPAPAPAPAAQDDADAAPPAPVPAPSDERSEDTAPSGLATPAPEAESDDPND
jgi:hypothetical protein